MARQHLIKDESGVSFIEFAFAFPVLMIITLTGIELTNFVVVHHQVRQIASMTADNASRLRTKMSEAYINQLFIGVDKAGEPIDFKANGRIILSAVQENGAADGQWIRWQRCFGDLTTASDHGIEGKGQSDNTLGDVNGLAAMPGSGIMLAEIVYDYEPLFPNGFTNDRRIEHEIAYVVRQRLDFGISGTGAATC